MPAMQAFIILSLFYCLIHAKLFNIFCTFAVLFSMKVEIMLSKRKIYTIF